MITSIFYILSAAFGHTCPLLPMLRLVWPPPLCIGPFVCCTPAASEVFLHGPQSVRKSLLTANDKLWINYWRCKFEIFMPQVMLHGSNKTSYILQNLICSHNIVTVGLKPRQCSRWTGFHILGENRNKRWSHNGLTATEAETTVKHNAF